MTTRARLVLWNLVAIAGAAVATLGAHATWFTITEPGRRIAVGGLGDARFPSASLSITGQDVAGDVAGLALLMLALLSIALFVGPRWRLGLLAVASLCGIAVVMLSSTVSSSDALVVARRAGSTFRTQPGIDAEVARIVALAGAAVATVAAIVCMPWALRARKVSLPEGAPTDDDTQP
jgi:hypothetical protein